ncbi:Uroporphyrinogen-III synthase HemD [Novymonas esmeraldas]|uniref:Uroporphyrinogen-III synthase HemD n=1 Tax=Novymonas esmeraldas TaxID=1808958 RepID=A0AAW0ERP2_9TRYP
MSSKPILITAPLTYSKRFASALEAHHLTPLAVPVIETVAAPDTADMLALLGGGFDGVDYIAFCSRCAVDSLGIALEQQGSPNGAAAALAKCALAAIGKDADYVVERLGTRPSICPDEPSPSGIAAKLAESGCAEGRTIAVLAPCVEGFEEPDVVPRFIEQLKGIGMRVVRVDAYVTRPVSEEALSTAVAALSDGSVRGVAFTSGGEIAVLLRRSPACLASVSVACFGPYTAGFAAKHGVTVACVAKDFSSFDGFAAAIEQHYAS